MKPKCPYCGGELSGRLMVPPMGKRMSRIYDAVASSGIRGIEAEDLAKAMYGPGETPAPSANGQLRVAIWTLNRKIASIGQKIGGRPKGGYRLYSTGEWNDSQDNKESNAHKGKE